MVIIITIIVSEIIKAVIATWMIAIANSIKADTTMFVVNTISKQVVSSSLLHLVSKKFMAIIANEVVISV